MSSYNVAVCGAFDVISYGDALFPIAVEYELRKRVSNLDNIILFAPNGTDHLYSNETKVFSYQKFEEIHAQYHFDMIIIGGGELLHFKPIVFHDEDGMELTYEPGYLWKMPIDFAKSQGIPYVINSVGIPNAFSKEEKNIIINYLSEARYVSVRDKYSYERLVSIIPTCMCVPDSLWNLQRYLPYKQIIDGEYIVIQYGTLYQVDQLIDVIQEIKRQYNYKIVILPINYCHTDRVIAEKMSEFADEGVLVFNNLLSVEDIYSVIAGAKLFIGTSLHGTLTAQINRVPVIIFDMYTSIVGKMDGLYHWLSGNAHIISDVNSIMNMIQQELEQSGKQEYDIVSDLQKKTDVHYDRLVDCIIGGVVEDE